MSDFIKIKVDSHYEGVVSNRYCKKSEIKEIDVVYHESDLSLKEIYISMNIKPYDTITSST